MAKLGFGKYADLELATVPEEYLAWLVQNARDNLEKYEGELQRREMVKDANISWVERIIKTGFNELAKRHHPDAGGKGQEMAALNAAHAKLRQAISE